MNKPEKHDGVSPIIVPACKNGIEYEVQFQYLWDYLVPESGRAQTAQGEMIRIAGRVRHEIMDNGCMNWDDDFRKMLKVFLEYALLGNPLPNNAKAAKKITGIVLKCGDNGYCNEYMCDGLCQCAAHWVHLNPDVMAPLDADYDR